MKHGGGSGGMPSRKFLKNKCSEIDSGEFCDQNLPLLLGLCNNGKSYILICCVKIISINDIILIMLST